MTGWCRCRRQWVGLRRKSVDSEPGARAHSCHVQRWSHGARRTGLAVRPYVRLSGESTWPSAPRVLTGRNGSVCLVSEYRYPHRERVVAIHLEALGAGRMPGVEADVGRIMAQAAIICFEDCRHSSGVKLVVEGNVRADPNIHWKPLRNPEQARRSWDPEDATEAGACGVAVLLIDGFTEYTIGERAMKWLGSRRGSGFDYWLYEKESSSDRGSPDPLSLGDARLEVSGIRKGDSTRLNARVTQKTDQTKQSDYLGIPAYVIVVEFGTPRSTMIRR